MATSLAAHPVVPGAFINASGILVVEIQGCPADCDCVDCY